jgi:hypothetical protein
MAGSAGAQEGPANAGGPPQAAPPQATLPLKKSDVARERDKDAYFAAIRKCDALKDVADRQRCEDAVRKQYGQM